MYGLWCGLCRGVHINAADTTGQFIPEAHGFDGTLLTSLPGFPTPIDSRILNATTQVPGYPFNADMNQGNELGIGDGPFIKEIDLISEWVRRLGIQLHREFQTQQFRHGISRTERGCAAKPRRSDPDSSDQTVEYW